MKALRLAALLIFLLPHLAVAQTAEGRPTDPVWNGSAASASMIAILKGIYGLAAGSVPAGTAIIGKVGVDQTTPGTTNGMAIVGVNAATALAGAGATGTGALRVTVAQDTATIAGSAPGTAGSASTNVVTVQGIGSMTKLLVTPDANSAVNVAQVNGVTTLTGAGAVGTGSARVAVGQDTTTIAGSAPGTAGSASANVVTVQGIASATPVIVSGTVQPGNTANTTPWLANNTTQYPSGSTAETASATGTTGATTATLAAVASNYTYICGFSIRANATAAATGNATVTGTITGTLNFTQWTAPLASGLGVTEEIFTPCVPGSGTNTAIAVVSAAPGTGGVVSVSAWGYYKTTTP
jgi:hypothetical protein